MITNCLDICDIAKIPMPILPTVGRPNGPNCPRKRLSLPPMKLRIVCNSSLEMPGPLSKQLTVENEGWSVLISTSVAPASNELLTNSLRALAGLRYIPVLISPIMRAAAFISASIGSVVMSSPLP